MQAELPSGLQVAQRELDRAIERHGYWSRQAQNDRRELDRLYARCRNRDGYR
jgi:hypothetical protein